MFTPCGVITLTTDFGAEGPFVATMKGRILTRFPAARIIDVTHDILVHWPAEAGFWLSRSWSYFPPGSVHVAVVDPGVGGARRAVAIRCGDRWLVGPDNGLLEPAARGFGVDEVVDVGASPWRLTPVSATFQGRDIFGPVAAHLALGETPEGPRLDGDQLVRLPALGAVFLRLAGAPAVTSMRTLDWRPWARP